MIADDSPCKPFDRHRKGLNLGEGAAMLVLASERTLRRSGMRARSFLLGYGSAGDAYHMTAPQPDGAGLRSAISEAMATSGVSPASVAFVNAHGTGTPDNDRVESRVLHDLLPGVPFLSTKGYTGHTLGAAGAIEAVFTAACLEMGENTGECRVRIARPRDRDHPRPGSHRGPGNRRPLRIARIRREQLGRRPRQGMSGTGRIVIEGVGVVGGFGCGIHDLSRALTGNGRSPGTLALPTGSGPVTIPAFRADVSRLEEFIPARTLRRIDHFSRLGLLGSHLALADAELPEAEKPRLGIIIASGYGAAGMTYAFLKSFIDDGETCASPTFFSSSVHNSAAAHISIQLGAKGPNLTVSDVHLSVPSALATARIWLAEERVQRVLFGAVDELSELTGYIRYRTRDASPTATMTPLRTETDTSIPGEGAAFLLLARENVSRGGYCTLDASTTGSLPIPGFPFPEPRLLVLGGERLPRIGATIRGGGAKRPRRVLHPPVRVHAGRAGLRPGDGRAHPQGGEHLPFPWRGPPRLPCNGSRGRRTGRRRSDLLPHARRRRGVRIDDARKGGFEMIKTRTRIACLVLCAALVAGLPQDAAAEKVPQWELGAGVAGLMLPDYRGSDEVRSYLLPVPYIIYRLEWVKVDRTGVKSILLNWEWAEVNLSLSATPPVRSKNNRAREGMSDLKPMVELGPSLDIHLWRSDDRRFKLDVRTPVRAAFTVESHPRDAGLSLAHPESRYRRHRRAAVATRHAGRADLRDAPSTSIFLRRAGRRRAPGSPGVRSARRLRGSAVPCRVVASIREGVVRRLCPLRHAAGGRVRRQSPGTPSLLPFRGIRDRVDTVSSLPG